MRNFKKKKKAIKFYRISDDDIKTLLENFSKGDDHHSYSIEILKNLEEISNNVTIGYVLGNDSNYKVRNEISIFSLMSKEEARKLQKGRFFNEKLFKVIKEE